VTFSFLVTRRPWSEWVSSSFKGCSCHPLPSHFWANKTSIHFSTNCGVRVTDLTRDWSWIERRCNCSPWSCCNKPLISFTYGGLQLLASQIASSSSSSSSSYVQDRDPLNPKPWMKRNANQTLISKQWHSWLLQRSERIFLD
jgi:hypothetical protein